MFKFASCGIVWLRKRWFGFINWVDNVNWLPWRDSKADILSVSASWERIKGLTLETSVFKSPYSGQFTLSTQLIKPNYLVILPTNAAPQFLWKLPPCIKKGDLSKLSHRWKCFISLCFCYFATVLELDT